MKRLALNLRCHRALLVSCFAAIALPSAMAQTTYYWEPDAIPNDGILDGGAGTWNSTNAFFTTSATDAGTAIAWPTGTAPNHRNQVIFGGTAGGSVTLSALTAYTPTGGSSTTTDLLLNNLTFATNGYTLAGSQIRFVHSTTNGSITVNSGITATINTNISGATVAGLANGVTAGNISNNVFINGGGTLNLGGGNGSLGFTIDGGTTVQVTAGTFSGFNLNTINNSSMLRPTAGGVLPAPSSYTTTAGAGTLDINGTTQTISTLGGALAVTNSTAPGSVTLNLTTTNNALTHSGVISNGTGKISLATTGTIAQGTGFSSTNTFSTQTLAGLNTYTGFTSLGRGTVALDFANAAAPAANILYNTGFGTPAGDDGKLIIALAQGTVNGVANSNWGSLATLQLTGKASTANSQQFNGLKLTGGAANLLINPNATANTITLNLGSTLERSAGSLSNFATTNATTALSANATINADFGTASTVLKDANGVAFAVIGGRDWAAKNAANTAITAASYTASTPTSFTANGDIAIPVAGAAVNDVRLGAATTISTLKFADTNRSGVHLGGNTLTTGGLLVSAANGVSGNFITGGTLTSPGATGSDIVIYANQGNTFGLGTVLADGTAATGFTKGGSGVITQLANNTFTGALTINEGGLIVRGTNTASAINLNGSQTNLTGTQLPGVGNTTAGAYVLLGNADATGSLGSGNINLGVNALLGIKRTDSFTLNNNIQGAGGITQGWSGTTTLVSAATAKYQHAGDTSVTAGTLKLDYAASNTGILPDSSRLALGGGTVEYATAAGTTHNDAVRDTILLAGGSTITKSGGGSGRLRLNTISTFGAGSTLNLTANGIADVDNTNTNGIIGATARMTVGSSGTYNWGINSTNAGDGAINGLATYAALGLAAGTDTTNSLQDLTAPTAFTGSRTTNTLKLTNTSGSGQSLDIVAGNTLALTAGGLLVTGTSEVQINNGILRSNSATASDLIIHQYNSGGLVINSVISPGTGTTTLTKTGDGLLTLGGTNTYNGVTYLNGGVTSISSNANLGAPASGQSVFLNNATLKVTADVGFFNGAVGTNNRAVGLSGLGGTIEVDASRTLTIAGAITGAGGLTKTGDGTLDIRNATFSGPTNVNAGTLRLGAAANPTRTDLTVGTSGTLDVFGFGNQIASLSGSGIVTNTGSAATLAIGSQHTDTSFSGQITNSTNALSLDKMGGGILTLTGANNNYTGSTTVSGGTLALLGSGVLPTAVAGNTFNLSSAAGTFDISGVAASNVNLRNLGGVAASSVILGAKTLTLTGAEGATFAGVISGAGGLTIDRSATATQILSSTNTYDGVTTITKGILQINSAGALGSTTGHTVINSTGSTTSTNGTFGGQLLLNGGISVAENITIQGTGDATNFQRALSSQAGTNTVTGTITLTGTAGYRIGTNGASTLNLGLIQRSTASGGTIIFDPSATGIVNVNTALDNNLGGITVHGGGLLSLNITGNDIGDVVTQNSSTLRVGATNALNPARNLTIGQGTLVNGAVGVGNDVGTLQLAGVGQTINSLNAFPNAGPAVNNASPSSGRVVTNTVAATTATLTVGNNNGTGTFDGIITDGAGLTAFSKVGNGNQTLTGTVDNSYTGATTVSGLGTLFLNNSLGSTPSLSIGSGSKVQLQAADRINDTAAINLNGGTLLTGGFNESVGILTLTGDNIVDLGAGSSVLRFADSSSAFWGSTLTVWNWTGSLTGGGTDQLFFGSTSSGLTSGQLANVSFLNPDGFAAGTYGATLLGTGELVPVPEPGALATTAFALAAALRRRRR